MHTEKARDIVIIICAIAFIIIYSLSTLLPIFAPEWYYEQQTSAYQDQPNIHADCTSEEVEEGGKPNTHTLTIRISNYDEDELKDVTCNLIDIAGLTSQETTQKISKIGEDSSDICSFELKGEYKKPIRFEVKYEDESISQAVTCY